jgi:hypothetical protein
MQAPLFVHSLADAERQALEAGLRSSDAFVLRRCQVLPASARGEHSPAIARQVGCSEQAVRNVLHAFNRTGLAALVYWWWLRRAARARPPKQRRLRPADWSRRSLVADPRLDRIEWR